MSDPNEPNVTNDSPSSAGSAVFAFRDAYERTAAERTALSEGELANINLAIPGIVRCGLAASPKVRSLASQIASLPLDHALVSNLETYSRAAGHVQSLYVISSAPPEELEEVYEAAVERRSLLKSDLTNLAKHGLVNADSVAAIKSDTGYNNVGYDLMSLVALYRQSSGAIQGRSAALPEDIDEAELLANQLLELAARRPERVVADPKIADARRRAVTLLMRAYDEARRAVVFLRWHQDDADTITPSLYAGRGKGKGKGTDAETPHHEAQVPTSVTEAAPASEPTAGTHAVPPGTRGGNPFS